MDPFLQIHTLTAYAPSNLNRDDLGRPKTARIGDTNRLRISSQSLKRAWRTSAAFEDALAGHIGTRTRRVGDLVHAKLKAAGVADKDATAWSAKISEKFGKVDKGKVNTNQLVHVSPLELQQIQTLADTLAREKRPPQDAELDLLRKETRAVDIGLFGRMLADEPSFNVDAAAQVGHAFTIHPVSIEDDYFTAVDDLNRRGDDTGAGHVNAAEFGSGIFYTYACVDRRRLVKNLGGDADLAKRALSALTRAMLTVSPSGKQNSFASRAYASYALAERGTSQPRSLAVAFMGTLGAPHLAHGIEALRDQRQRFAKAYGDDGASYEMDVHNGRGTLAELEAFVQG